MRRSFVPVALAIVFSASIAQAKAITAAPPAQDPAAPAAQAAPAAPDPLRFTADDVVVIMSVMPGKSADFEMGWKQMTAAIAASDNPELKALGESMTLSKADIAGQELYVLQIHNASKTLSYSWGKIIYYSGKDQSAEANLILKTPEGGDPVKTRADADAMFGLIQNSVNASQVSVLPLRKVGG